MRTVVRVPQIMHITAKIFPSLKNRRLQIFLKILFNQVFHVR